ncbi:hypothetical protein ACFQV8_30685 [Pseudonocardia benzenivorans]
MSRTRSDLVAARVAAGNQLAALLDTAWPGAKEIFAEVTSAISLAFLHRYPTPDHAAHLGEKRMAAFCIKHGYSGRRSPAELLTRLRAAPAGVSGAVVSDALRDAVLALIAVLTALNTAIKDLDRSNAAHLHAHPDGKVFTSFPAPDWSTPPRSALSSPNPTPIPDRMPSLPSPGWSRSPARRASTTR